MSAPFVWIFVCFAAGIVAAQFAVVPSWAVFGLVPLAAISFRSRYGIAITAQLLLILIIAGAMTQKQMQMYNGNELRRWVESNARQTCVFRGVLLRTPELGSDYFVIQVETESVSGKPIHGIARITVTGIINAELHAGDRIESYARFRMPRNFKTDGAFDYEGYLRKEGIHVLASIKNGELIRVIGSSNSIARAASFVRLKGILKISSAFEEKDAGILRALWLDDRGGMSQQDQQELIDAGVFHVVAISGFHFTVLVFLLFLALEKVTSFGKAVLFACSFLAIYFVILEGRSSVTRSFLSFLIYALAVLRHDRVSLANWISISALIQLIINPLQLYDTGFHLTYLSTATILFLIVPLSRRFASLPKILQVTLNLLISGIILQLVLMPYIVYIFHRVAIYSIAANLIAVPLSSILIALSVMFFPAKISALILTPLIHQLLALLRQTTALFSGCGVLTLATPPLCVVFVFYFCLSSFVVTRSNLLRYLSIALCCSCLFFLLYPRLPRTSGELRLHFLDVGQGDSILIEYPNGTADLVDGGGFFNSDAMDTGQSIVIPYLCRNGITQLNRVFLTHAHADHMNGLISVLRYVPVNELYVSRQPFGDRGYQFLVRSINKTPRAIHSGALFREGEVVVRVLTPDDSRKTKRVANDDSLVLLLEYAGRRVLLTGDAEAAEERLLASRLNDPVDLIKVPHHGSKTSSSLDLLMKIRPKIAIASLGYENWFGHPDDKVVERYRQIHALFYRTDLNGTVVVRISRRDGALCTN